MCAPLCGGHRRQVDGSPRWRTPDEIRRTALFARFEADTLVSMIQHEPIGADDVTDLVLANLKPVDYVGHAYGPDSPELRETVA